MTQRTYILQQNLRRSPQAVDELLNTANKHSNQIGDCSIFMLQEPPLDSLLRVKGFPLSSVVLSDIIDPRSAIVITSSNVRFRPLPQFTNSFCTSATIMQSGTDFVICSIYFPPNCDISPFLDHVEKVLQDYGNLPILLFGDFNCAHTRWNCRSDTTRGRRLLEFVVAHGLSIYETPGPSYRHLDGRNSHIDLLIANQRASLLVGSWNQLTFNIYTDHSPQIAVIGGPSESLCRKQLSTWRFCEQKADWAAFSDSFCSDRIDSILNMPCNSTDDVDHLIRSLTDLIIDSAYKSLPIKKQSSTTRKSLKRVWWDHEVSLLHGDVKRFKNRVRRCTNSVVRRALVERYLVLKRRLELLCKEKSESSWKQYICDGDDSEAKNWGNGYKFIQLKMSNRTQSDQFLEGESTFVAENISSLLKSFFPSDASTVAPVYREGPFVFRKHSFRELSDVMKRTDKKKAPGLDHISNSMMKNLPMPVKAVIQGILLKCLELGYFPECWKISAVKIIPKPNKSDYTIASSYRPISLTSNLSKLLEKIINYHLVYFLEFNNVIHQHQYGFRAGRSTADALQRILTLASQTAPRIRKAIVSFDFKSAFDFAPHSMIIQELNAHNAPSFLIAIISSYLLKRKVCMKLSDMNIEHAPEGRGCPQGGILSPVLWSVVVNSLLFELDSQGFEPTAYADDLTLVCQGKDDLELRDRINTVTSIVRAWSERTGIRINVDKSNALPIGQRSIPILPNLDLRVARDTCILGVTFVSSLKFDLHVKKKLASVSKYLDIIRRHFSRDFGLTCDSKCVLYNCYVKPMLLYASEIWGGRITVNTLRTVRTFENAVIRNAIHGFRSTSTNSMHALTSIPLVDDLIKGRVAAFESRVELAPTFPNNPLFSDIKIIDRNDNVEDSVLVVTVSCRQDPVTGFIFCCSFVEGALMDIPTIITKYGFMTDTEDAVANSIRKVLKSMTQVRRCLSKVVVLTHVPSCLHADRTRISKNTMKIKMYLTSLDCQLFLRPHHSHLFNEPFSFDTDRVCKFSYTYSSLSKLKSELNNDLQTQISTALQECRSGVRTAAACRGFHRRILNQATTTFITEHGPTREYLCRRRVVESDLCPQCFVSETYEHVSLYCPRFQRIHQKFDTYRFCNVDELITSLMRNDLFTGFCQDIFVTLRSFNSHL